MNEEPRAARNAVPLWLILLVAVGALVLATAALTATLFARDSGFGFPMMGAFGGMTGGYRSAPTQVGPGEAGFVAGTKGSPRVIHVFAGPGYAFAPASISVARGETVTFTVTTMGPAVHEFMVGPADAVAADTEGTPEVAGIAMMQTRNLTYTFDGAGPYAFACHEAGHYEAGMKGAIVLVG